MAKADPTTLTGPATVDCLPEITLQGDSYERGLAYGKAFAKPLEEFYYWFVKDEPSEVLTAEYRGILERLEGVTATHFPQLLEEIKGWSDGAKLPYDMCRLMAFHNDIRSLIRPGCSNVICLDGPGGPWLARNCDLFEHERSWQVMIRCECDDCFSHAGVSYLGLPGSVGVNETGLAIGGSSLPAKPPAEARGLPNFGRLLLLTQESVAGCLEQFEQVGGSGKGAHWALLDASGDGVAVEAGTDRFSVRRADESGFLVVTNHTITGEIEPYEGLPSAYTENSKARYDRLVEIMTNAKPQERTPQLAQAALGDHEREISVCQHVPDGFHTISSSVVAFGKRESEMWLCWGYPCGGRYEKTSSPW